MKSLGSPRLKTVCVLICSINTHTDKKLAQAGFFYYNNHMDNLFHSHGLDIEDSSLPEKKNTLFDPVFTRKAYGALLRYFGDKGEYAGIRFSSHDGLGQKREKLKLFFDKVHELPKEARLDIQQEIFHAKNTVNKNDEDYLDTSAIDWDEIH